MDVSALLADDRRVDGRLGVAFVVGVALAAPAAARATPALHAPWPCEVAYRVTNGHATSTHTGMDEWAWDFGIPVGGVVVAPAAGVVRRVRMDSSRGGCDSAYANDANYVIVDFEDGTEALLMHLQTGSSSLAVGDRVAGGDEVGRVGLTGWVCGAHLHFQIQRTCSSWWCQSISAAFLEAGDPAEGTTVVSANCPVEEPCLAVLDGGTTVIDELSPCFERESSWWWDVATGHEGHHYYTWANAEAEADTVGRWLFAVATPGRYLVEASLPGVAGASREAVYLVDGGGGPEASAPVDQSAAAGWAVVGEAVMTEGEARSVSLADNTGEDRSLDRMLLYDALRLTYQPDEVEDGGPDGDGDADGDLDGDGDWEGEDAGPDADSSARADADAPPDADGAREEPDGAVGGCACRASRGPDGRGAGALLALLAAAALARRRLRA